jgi:hypothetical protein
MTRLSMMYEGRLEHSLTDSRWWIRSQHVVVRTFE